MIISCVFGPDPEKSDYQEIMRNHRNRLLAQSDWAMLSDAPTDKQLWGSYRQALRDFPATWNVGPVAEFPDPPA